MDKLEIYLIPLFLITYGFNYFEHMFHYAEYFPYLINRKPIQPLYNMHL